MASRTDWRTLSPTPPSRGPQWSSAHRWSRSPLGRPPWTRPRRLTPLRGGPHFRLCSLGPPRLRGGARREWILAGGRVGPLGPRSRRTLAGFGPSSSCQHSARLLPPRKARWRKGQPGTGRLSRSRGRCAGCTPASCLRSRTLRVQGLPICGPRSPTGLNGDANAGAPTSAEEPVSQESLAFAGPQNPLCGSDRWWKLSTRTLSSRAQQTRTGVRKL